MSDRIGTLKRGGHSRGCHVDVAEDPKGPRQFRVIARKKGAQVGLYSRPGNDLTRRFPLIVETLARLRSRSCIIDGEAVACDENVRSPEEATIICGGSASMRFRRHICYPKRIG
jgi:hypothetical protein